MQGDNAMGNSGPQEPTDSRPARVTGAARGATASGYPPQRTVHTATALDARLVVSEVETKVGGKPSRDFRGTKGPPFAILATSRAIVLQEGGFLVRKRKLASLNGSVILNSGGPPTNGAHY